MTVTDEMLMAYVDGELSPHDIALVDAAVAADRALAARLESHRRLAGAVAGAFADVAHEPVPDRLTDSVSSGGKVVSLDAVRQSRAGLSAGQWGLIAAGIVAGLAVGVSLPRGPAALVGGDMRARGQLAAALDSQLASAPQEGALVKVGLSFRSQDNRYCRTFAVTRGEGPAGLACRDRDGWTVRMAVARAAATPAGDYRTAAADTPPEIIAAAQAIMLDAPLDAADEAAAKARGWR